MNALSDRYVAAVTNQLPEATRADVARELRATIEDTIEAKGPTVSRSEAERTALIELGDPDLLAASYRGRPLALIGPELYPKWVELTKLLLVIIPPLAGGGALIGQLLAERSLGQAISASALTIFWAIIHVVFWTTFGFALAERHGARAAELDQPWTPDNLPSIEDPLPSVSESIGVLIGYGAGIALLIAAINPTLTADGTSTLLITAAAWPWRWLLVAALGGSILLEVVKLARQRWTMPLAIFNCLLEVAFVAPIAWFALRNQLITTEAQAIIEQWIGWRPLTNGIMVGLVILVAIALWSCIAGVRKARAASGASQ